MQSLKRGVLRVLNQQKSYREKLRLHGLARFTQARGERGVPVGVNFVWCGQVRVSAYFNAQQAPQCHP
jgi:hypothetical protein